MQNSLDNRARGSNLLGVGQYNERLVLQLVRRTGGLPKAQIARMTGLSAQTVSVIINRLLKNRLLKKQPTQREKGKVGQPATPISLNPQGAFSIGVKIGRSSLDVLMINFIGEVIKKTSHAYNYPDPDTLFDQIDVDIEAFFGSLSDTHKKRVVGIGVVAPFNIGSWGELEGAPQSALDRWNNIDIRQRVSENQALPVWFSNDATAACIAELEFGNASQWNDFLYFFVGALIGGGVVQNGTLTVGSSGNAGAIGSMLIPAAYSGDESFSKGPSVQLLHCASRYLLNRRLQVAGYDPGEILEQIGKAENGEAPLPAVAIFDEWLGKVSESIAVAVAISVSVIDFKGIIIDGLLPHSLVERLTSAVEEALSQQNMAGLTRPKIRAGVLGNESRAIGGAVLPFYLNFTPDMNVLLNLSANRVD